MHALHPWSGGEIADFGGRPEIEHVCDVEGRKGEPVRRAEGGDGGGAVEDRGVDGAVGGGEGQERGVAEV